MRARLRDRHYRFRAVCDSAKMGGLTHTRAIPGSHGGNIAIWWPCLLQTFYSRTSSPSTSSSPSTPKHPQYNSHVCVCLFITAVRWDPLRNLVLEHRVCVFSFVPRVWESNPKILCGWCKTEPPAHRGSHPGRSYSSLSHVSMRQRVCVFA